VANPDRAPESPGGELQPGQRLDRDGVRIDERAQVADHLSGPAAFQQSSGFLAQGLDASPGDRPADRQDDRVGDGTRLRPTPPGRRRLLGSGQPRASFRSLPHQGRVDRTKLITVADKVRSRAGGTVPRVVDWRLELVVVPVSDVDRAKAFYTEKAGFHADHDQRVSDDLRFVQLTPPGSACSIALGTGLSDKPPGSASLQLVVSDIHAARGELLERGVEVGEVQEFGWGSFVFFNDPDGNSWAVQQIPAWAEGRADRKSGRGNV
jgi:catechol 2,3-dioxygenase-like lactoylglutathione lyase family enzyme